MRYLYAALLILFTGAYTYSGGNVAMLGADIADGRDDDDRGGGWKKDDDDRGGGDDDDDNGGGNNTSFDVQVNSGLNFTLSQPDHLENKQTIYNALKLQLKSKKNDCSVYAKVTNYTTPNGAPSNSIPLELEHRNNTSKKVYGLVNNLQLTHYDQQLFSNKKDNSNNNFFYDLNLLPLGYDYPEGQYNFTILFTMTQP